MPIMHSVGGVLLLLAGPFWSLRGIHGVLLVGLMVMYIGLLLAVGRVLTVLVVRAGSCRDGWILWLCHGCRWGTLSAGRLI